MKLSKIIWLVNFNLWTYLSRTSPGYRSLFWDYLNTQCVELGEWVSFFFTEKYYFLIESLTFSIFTLVISFETRADDDSKWKCKRWLYVIRDLRPWVIFNHVNLIKIIQVTAFPQNNLSAKTILMSLIDWYRMINILNRVWSQNS